MNPIYRVLCLGPDTAEPVRSAWGEFRFEPCADLQAVAARLRESQPDALLLHLPDAAPLLAWGSLSHAVLDAAVVLVLPGATADVAASLLQAGLQDVLPAAEPEALVRALRLGIERKAIERTARKAYATDLSTGLPNHAQLLEHMTHLLALREREPAPMALIVLRVEGLARAGDVLGAEAVNVLRRKAAVRLRAALRASDVVASIGTDAFAVLLAWIDSPADGDSVMRKLAHSLAEPYTVAGRRQTLAVSAGLASVPEHGKEAEVLLRRALGQATQTAAVGTAGAAQAADRGPAAAANDE